MLSHPPLCAGTQDLPSAGTTAAHPLAAETTSTAAALWPAAWCMAAKMMLQHRHLRRSPPATTQPNCQTPLEAATSTHWMCAQLQANWT